MRGLFSLAGGDRSAWPGRKAAWPRPRSRPGSSLVDAQGVRTTIGEVRAGIGTFLFRRARRDTEYRFAVCALDARNREGALAFVTVPKAV